MITEIFLFPLDLSDARDININFVIINGTRYAQKKSILIYHKYAKQKK